MRFLQLNSFSPIRKQPVQSMLHPSLRLGMAAAIMLAFPAYAQPIPDAGQLLQQPQSVPPPAESGPAIEIDAPAVAIPTPGGAELTLTGLSISGATAFSEAELLAVLGDVVGRRFDFAGLRGLADQLSAHYHARGYPFARAYLPPQSLEGGILRIELMEGRYGEVRATGDAPLAEAANGFLAPLQRGEVIAAGPLERATLLLDDLPGIKAVPVIRPGQDIGTGDLDVRVSRAQAFSGDAGLDNHGNRYTGEHRARSQLQWDSPFLFGDQLLARVLVSDERLWTGSLGYSLPLGSSGLRGNVGYAHTRYQLGKDFANLDATGTARVGSVGATYPLLRSRQANLTLALTYQHKALNDRQQLAGTDDDKSSDSLPLSVGFDRRDKLWGGGITYGSLAYTPGRLRLGSALEAADRSSGQNRNGRFDKLNLDLVRAQATPIGAVSLFGRFSGQWAGKNLDSSERFSLGGANGVRAYPSGEGIGDEGWLLQLEIRYQLGGFAPYVFHDSGSTTIYARPAGITPAVTNNRRSLSGQGVGLRYAAGAVTADVAIAWRDRGGAATSDSLDRAPRAWATIGYRF